MRIHTIITHLILSALITTSINAYASDWQISRIIKNQVFLIPIDSIRDTGIASKSAKIVAINRDRICVIEYYQAHTGLTKPKSVDPYGNLMLTSTSPWDLASYSIEVDCDTNQYRYIEPVKYFYNGEFIKDDSPISEGDGWMSSKKKAPIFMKATLHTIPTFQNMQI